MSLNHQDVQEILRLLDASPYDDLQLQTGNFALTLRRTADGSGWQQESRTLASFAPVPTAVPAAGSGPAVAEPAAAESGLLDVRAPMVGTFYRAPKPGAEPFVSPGSLVAADTVIAIIEVMKLMSAIVAGVNGEVVEILAADAQFVEKGQLLLRVRPPQP